MRLDRHHHPPPPPRVRLVGQLRHQPVRPLFAGITALAAQVAGHPLGPLNPLLYQLHGHHDGILDITHGNNTDHGVRGYSAEPGYDLPSGIGTIASAPAFVAALTRLAAHR